MGLQTGECEVKVTQIQIWFGLYAVEDEEYKAHFVMPARLDRACPRSLHYLKENTPILFAQLQSVTHISTPSTAP
jgi:hypothetical protein